MATLNQILGWAQSGEGRLMAAAVLFLVMWCVKSVPKIRDYVSTPRRKQAASLLLALAPAAWLMVDGAPWLEIATTALSVALMANGINTYRPSKSNAK